jgi:hypothetical protein
MKTGKKLTAMAAILCSLHAQGESNLVITSFSGNGKIEWIDEATTNYAYTVEWTSSLDKEWNSDWENLSYICPTGTLGIAEVPMFFRIRKEASKSPNSRMSGAWFMGLRDDEEMDTIFITCDGEGHITDTSAFNMVELDNQYSVVHPNGVFWFRLGEGEESFHLYGKIDSEAGGHFFPPFSELNFEKVPDLGACSGNWSGTLVETNGPSVTKEIAITVSDSGEIVDCSGLATPVSGKMYSLSDGYALLFIRTGESDIYNQVSLRGMISGGTLAGSMSLDNSSGKDGTVTLSRE